jgi:hypothetical protein
MRARGARGWSGCCLRRTTSRECKKPQPWQKATPLARFYWLPSTRSAHVNYDAQWAVRKWRNLGLAGESAVVRTGMRARNITLTEFDIAKASCNTANQLQCRGRVINAGALTTSRAPLS